VETQLPWRVRDKKSGVEMLLVPPGKFVMGMSPRDTEGVALEKALTELPELKYSERPAHEVTMTEAEWEHVCRVGVRKRVVRDAGQCI